jgi:hypothetical protein
MEALNAMLRTADERLLFEPLHAKVRERTFFYADDVVIFLSTKQQDLVLLKVILEISARRQG